MPVIKNIADLSQTADLNGPDGTSDPPSSLDDQMRYLGAFIAQLRDGVGFAIPIVGTGTIAMHGGPNAPSGWLTCNGAAVSRATYSRLFSVIGTYWGAGDGSTTFNVPDFRGVVPRGVDSGRGLDPNRVFGSFQNFAVQSHAHGVNDPTHAHGVADGGHNHYVNDPGHAHGGSTSGVGNHSHMNGMNNAIVGDASLYKNWYYPGQCAIVGWNGGLRTDDQGAHSHSISTDARGTGIWLNASGAGIGIYGAATGISIQAAGEGETRMANAACLFVIRT